MDDASSGQRDAPVTDFMVADPPTLRPDDTVIAAARLMAETGLPGIPVLADGHLVGILTESNLIAREAEVEVPASLGILDALFAPDVGRHFADEMQQVLATTVEGLMTTRVTTVLPGATLTQVATVMADRHINPVPVVDAGGALVGLVSRRDIIRVVAALDEQAG